MLKLCTFNLDYVPHIAEKCIVHMTIILITFCDIFTSFVAVNKTKVIKQKLFCTLERGLKALAVIFVCVLNTIKDLSEMLIPILYAPHLKTLSMPISYNLIHVGKMHKDDCLFVSLGFFLSHSRIFQSFVDVPIADEELQIFTYARHSWSLSKRDI